MKYSRKFLRSLRLSACTPCPQVLVELKSYSVLRYRGGKGGKKTRGNYLNIFSRTTQSDYANFGYLQAPLPLLGVNLNNLISVTTTDSPKIDCRRVQFCVLNVRSITNKAMAVKDLVVDQALIFWLSLKLGCVLVTLMMLRLEPYVQLAIDFYMF